MKIFALLAAGVLLAAGAEAGTIPLRCRILNASTLTIVNASPTEILPAGSVIRWTVKGVPQLPNYTVANAVGAGSSFDIHTSVAAVSASAPCTVTVISLGNASSSSGLD